jgi:hypothetical protein
MANLQEQEFDIENDLLINTDNSISVSNHFAFCDKNLKRGRDKIKNWTFKSKLANNNYKIRSSEISNYTNNNTNNLSYAVNCTDSTGILFYLIYSNIILYFYYI